MKKLMSSVKYDVVKLIAEGGMGSVFKAMKKGADGFEKVVAIKTLLESYSQDKLFVKRFIEEAKLVANLVHENIVQIYQLDKYKGEYYFVLEFVDGISLYDFMEFHRKAKSSFPAKLSVFVASRIARGLAYAHSRRDADGNPLNIVHCDVCPHNILITTEGLPKITDFGIARAQNMTTYETISGKLPFMSPEQARGEVVDFRSDIYSLGAVLFFCLTGESVRNLKSDLKDILKQAKENYIQWEMLPDSIDPDLRRILEKSLSTDLNDRYQDTSEIARELEYYIYKDGYGPTIVTLSKYMREQMPVLFENNPEPDDNTLLTKTKSLQETTLVMDQDASQDDGHKVDMSGKTVVLPKEYFDKYDVNLLRRSAALALETEKKTPEK